MHKFYYFLPFVLFVNERRGDSFCDLLATFKQPVVFYSNGYDLPGFCGRMISRKMAPNSRGAHEEELIHGRADGGGAARGRPHYGCGSGQEA
jgi:hypothetical protein